MGKDIIEEEFEENNSIQNLTDTELISGFEYATSKLLLLFNELSKRKKAKTMSKDDMEKIGIITINFVCKLFEQSGMDSKEYDKAGEALKTVVFEDNR